MIIWVLYSTTPDPQSAQRFAMHAACCRSWGYLFDFQLPVSFLSASSFMLLVLLSLFIRAAFCLLIFFAIISAVARSAKSAKSGSTSPGRPLCPSIRLSTTNRAQGQWQELSKGIRRPLTVSRTPRASSIVICVSKASHDMSKLDKSCIFPSSGRRLRRKTVRIVCALTHSSANAAAVSDWWSSALSTIELRSSYLVEGKSMPFQRFLCQRRSNG